MIKTVSIIGAGNVAHSLGQLLVNSGISIDAVFSAHSKNSVALAEKLGARAANSIDEIEGVSDLLLLAVKDDVLAEVGNTLRQSSQLMAHTSGSVDMKVLGKTTRSAVFYPLQTFSKEKEYDGLPFPICIEVQQEGDLEGLKALGTSLVGADNVYEIDSHQRKTLHVAAVFACNFSNYFYAIADEILKERNLPFEILKPLIRETISKIDEKGPAFYQSGPAVRGDQKIINDHLEYLDSNNEYRQLYQMLTDQIKNRD